jgi:Tfp pilus assembly protein PilX
MMQNDSLEYAVAREEDLMKIGSRSNRKSGFVLLTVVLVSALLIISATMFTAQLAVESRITKTDSVFKSALSLAEAGLNTVMSDIKNNADATTWADRLENGGYDVPVAVSALMHGTTSVTVDVVPGTKVATGVADQYTAEIELTAIGAVFPPSVSATDMPTSLDYMARRAVLTRAQATWTFRDAYTILHPEIPGNPGSDAIPEVGHWSVTPFSIGYGVFTGGAFSTQGAAKEIHGDVYAGGLATIKKGSIVDGIVYSSGGLAGQPPAGSVGNAPSLNFPYIDVSYYRALFTAYVNGTFPYNAPDNQIPGTGTDPVTNPVAYYTCTNPLVVGNMRSAYGVDDLRDLTTEVMVDGKIYRIIKDVPEDPIRSDATTEALVYMMNPTAAYFVSGDLHITGNITLTGSLVVDGTIFVNGNADIEAGVKMPAIMATGDFVKDNGTADIEGLVYTEGSFTGTGTANILGALYAYGEVSMSGTMDIEYDSSIGSIVTGATWIVDIPGEDAVGPTTGTAEWYEYIPPFCRMDDLGRVAEGSRVWAEVVPDS